MGEQKLLSNDCFDNGDVYFCSFYYKAVKRLFDIDSEENVSYLRRYLKILKMYYDIFCEEDVKRKYRADSKTIMKLLKDSFYHRLVYIYRNATLLSSAVAFHFKNVCEKNPKYIERIIKKKIIKICSIGGSLPSDIVAILTVFKSIASKSGVELEFRVAIIVPNADWWTICISVLSCLDEFHYATWKINFFVNDLTNMDIMTKEMVAAIRDADVISMVKSPSQLGHKKDLVKMLCSELKVQAILLILDSCNRDFTSFCLEMSDSDYLSLMYAVLHDYHSLDIAAVKQFQTLYGKHFRIGGHFKINVSFDLFACGWTKAKSGTSLNHIKSLENLQSFFEPQVEINKKFIKWENLFTTRKKAAGWTAEKIKKSVEKNKRKRANKLVKPFRQKKEANSLQNYLLTRVQSYEDDGKGPDEAKALSLNDHFAQEREYSIMKKKAYFAALSANKLRYMLN